MVEATLDGLTQADILTVEEAAEYLRIGRSLAYEMVRRGEIPHLRFGKRVVVPRKALVQYVEDQTAPNVADSVDAEREAIPA